MGATHPQPTKKHKKENKMTNATYAIRRNQNLYRTKTKVQLGPVSVSFVMIAAISLLALLYLNQITKTSVFGYRFTELDKQRKDLLAQKQDLEVEAARLQSIQQIQNSETVKHMVTETPISYVR